MASIGPLQLGHDLFVSETLTALFSDNTSEVFLVGREMGQLILNISYTPKAGQSNRYLIIRAEFGYSNDSLFQLTQINDCSDNNYLIYKPYDIVFPDYTGTTGGVEYRGTIPIPVAHKYGRISVKESGTDNFGVISLDMILTSRSS